MSSNLTANVTGPTSTILKGGAFQHPLFYTHPIYYSPTPSLLASFSDPVLAAIAPFPAYWLVAGFFHILDTSNWAWLNRYRLHDSAEVASRNRASRLTVLFAVLFQQVIQTILGLLWVSEPPERVDHAAAMSSIAYALARPLGLVDAAGAVAPLAYLVYWWLLPVAQLFVAMYAKPFFVSLPLLTLATQKKNSLG
jgi:sphinganine C4-monooxygenase